MFKYVMSEIIIIKKLFQPQNLVMMGDFPDCDVKVCDFEISRVIVEGTEIREILGTPEYVGECACTVYHTRDCKIVYQKLLLTAVTA